jgi:hypothetical protein
MADENNTNRSTLIALLVAGLFFGSIALYYVLRPSQATATALFSVSSAPVLIVGDAPRFDQREFEVFQRTQLALLKSYFLVQSALRAPGMQALSVLAPHEDKVDWIIENLDSKFEGDSEVLSISLSGPADQAQDLCLLVDAVSDAYLKEVVFDDRQRRLILRDAKQASLGTIAELLRKKGHEIHKLETAPADDPTELNALKRDFAMDEELYRDLYREVVRADVEDVSPNRIRRVQKATIEKD